MTKEEIIQEAFRQFCFSADGNFQKAANYVYDRAYIKGQSEKDDEINKSYLEGYDSGYADGYTMATGDYYD